MDFEHYSVEDCGVQNFSIADRWIGKSCRAQLLNCEYSVSNRGKLAKWTGLDWSVAEKKAGLADLSEDEGHHWIAYD